ncbi:hypothetical protein PM082_024250 [Marasmius tenuissimus]|nr:hypothetical protein PM082_024250 [Marasmius tenuissimus]
MKFSAAESHNLVRTFFRVFGRRFTTHEFSEDLLLYKRRQTTVCPSRQLCNLNTVRPRALRGAGLSRPGNERRSSVDLSQCSSANVFPKFMNQFNPNHK